MDAQLRNLSDLAEIVKASDPRTDARKQALLGYVPEKGKRHVPDHSMCEYDDAKDGDKVTEKRICRCMHYFNCDNSDQKAKCEACGFPWKKRNASDNLWILDYEVPVPYVVDGVGGIDLLAFTLDDYVYAIELKPENSNESLARMISEIMTYCEMTDYEVGRSNVPVLPAICFFEGSKQHEDFKNLKDCDAFLEASAEVCVFMLSYDSDSFRIEMLMGYRSHRLDSLYWELLERHAHQNLLPHGSLEDKVLVCLKSKFEASRGASQYQLDERSGLKRRFYLDRWEDNLVREMDSKHFGEYGEGDGNEIGSGNMCALRSSSAMTFNLLGNLNCTIKEGDAVLDAGRYAVSYEYKPATPLKKGRKANLDALLVDGGGKTVIACEMKMLEWLTSTPRPLVENYVCGDAYRYADVADVFAEVAKNCRTAKALDVYDAPQMFRHLTALYNACREGEWPELRKLVLLNCVWEPNLDDFSETETRVALGDLIRREHNGFAAFKAACKPLFKCFEDLGIELLVEYRTAAELIDLVEHPAEERNLLQRYC